MLKKVFTVIFFLFFIAFNVNSQALPGSGNTLQFNGVNNYINLGTSNRNVTNKVTVEAWIKTTSLKYQWIVGKYNNGEDKGYHILTQNGKAALAGREGVGTYRISGYSTTLINDGKWHHIVGVVNLNAWEIWVDGKLENSIGSGSNNPNLSSSAPLTIGNYALVSDLYFVGEIDEVRIWNTARTGQEIRDNMCRKLVPTSPGLVGYYKLDEATGTNTADQSSSNITGTLTGFAPTTWHTSGAPIGDISTNLYTSNWTNIRVKLAGLLNDTLIAQDINSNASGVQIYRVNSAPNVLPPNFSNAYFGIFTAGSNISYTVGYKPATITCNTDSAIVAKRQDNATTSWQTFGMPLNTSNTYFEKSGEVYRSEYHVNVVDARAKVQISGNLNACFGAPLPLTASASSSYLWNTGQTTQTISPTASGKYYVTATNALGCITSDTVFVTITPPLNADAGVDKTICRTYSTTTSTTIGAFAIPGYTYSWSPAVGLSSTTVANPTVSFPNTTNLPLSQTYTLTVTYNGCTAIDQVIITLNPHATVISVDPVMTCSDVPVVLGIPQPPGQTYLWTPATGLSDPTNPTPTVTLTNNTNSYLDVPYTLTATNSSGCTISGLTYVTVLPAAVATAGPDVSFCNGSNATLGAAPTPNYTYSWSPVVGLSNPNIADPTVTLTNNTSLPITQTYTLTSTRYGCSSTDQVVVTINPVPVPVVGPGRQVCPNEPTTIGGQAVTGYTYSWFPAVGLSNSSVANPTVILPNTSTSGAVTQTYTLTVSNTNGCTASNTVQVNVKPTPIADAGIDKTICSSETTSIGSNAEANHTYSWSPALGLSNPNISNPAVTLLNNTSSPITQTFTLTATRAGCVSTEQVTITVNPLPFANAGTNKTICSNESVVVGTLPVSGNTYSWAPALGLSNASVSNPTATLTNSTNSPITQTYILTVTNSFGCSKSDTVRITINPLPISNAGNDKTICSSSATTLGTGPTQGYTYSWSPAIGLSNTTSSNPTVSLTNISASPITQTYTVTSTSYGCVTTDQVTVTVQPATLADAGIDKTICGGKSVRIGTAPLPNYSYSWAASAGISNTTSATPVYTGTNNTANPIPVKLYLTATSLATNCTAIDSVIITVNSKPPIDSIIGSNSVCPGVLGVDYHIKNPRLTAYQWIVEGGTIASGQGTTVITVNWGPSGPGKVKTYTLNTFGCSSDTVLFPVIINPLLITQKPAGPRQLCFYEAKNIYYQPPVVTNGSFYTYQVFGGTITSPNPSTSGIYINWNAPGIGKIVVTETSTTNLAFCFGVSDTLLVTINPSPDTTLAINGSASGCAFSSQHIYNLPGSAGSTYKWTFNGNTLQGNGNTVSLTLPAAGNYTLSVLETNSLGCPGRTITKTITATPLPGTLIINGPAIICPDNQHNLQYSVIGLPGSTYNWKITGGTITSGNGSNTIYVDFDNTRDKTIEVIETSSGNCVGSPFSIPAKLDGSVLQLAAVSTTEANFRDIELSFNIQDVSVNNQPIDIYRRESGAGNTFRKIASIPNSQQKYTDQNLATEQKIYEYRLESMNECGTQIRKTIEHNAIKLSAAPEEVSKTAFLTWNTYKGWGINGVSKYEIYGKADNGSYAKILETKGNDSVATLANIAPKGFDQCFRLKAISNSGLISWSNETCITFKNDLVVYNIVTDNGDGKNDFFTVENIHLYLGNELTIYNRWGVEVYKQKDYLNKWSGNGVADGTYYYLLKLKDGRSFKGWFEIVR